MTAVGALAEIAASGYGLMIEPPLDHPGELANLTLSKMLPDGEYAMVMIWGTADLTAGLEEAVRTMRRDMEGQ